MNVDPVSIRRNCHIVIRLALLVPILIAGMVACQTTEETKKAKPNKVLDKRKALIRNAIDTGKTQFAMRDLRPLIAAHPRDPGLHNLMGLTQMSLRNYSRAIASLKRAYRLKPQPSYALNLSSALIESGDHNRAANLVRFATRKWPKYRFKERFHHNLGYSSIKQRKFSAGEHWLRKALEENPTFYPSHIELARLYKRTKRPALARNSYRRAVDFCSTCFEPVGALVQDYLRMGQLRKARSLLVSYGRVEGIAPRDKNQAKNLLAMTERRLRAKAGKVQQRRRPQRVRR